MADTEAEFTVGDQTYRCRRLSAFDAYDVARKWSYVFLMMAKAENMDAGMFARGFVPFTAPVPKADNDFALNLCLSSVERKVSGDKGWVRLYMDGQLRIPLEMPQMLEVLYHVIMANKLVDFFVEPRSNSEQQDAAGETAKS